MKNGFCVTKQSVPIRRYRAQPWIALLGFLCLSSPRASDAEEEPKADSAESFFDESVEQPVVQNRLFRTEHEFNVGLAILPADAFYKGIAVAGGYAWHIDDLWAAEARFHYAQTFSSSLRDDLEGNFNIPSTRFAELKWFAEAGALCKPIYSKLSLFNDTLVYGEFYLSAHFIVAQLDGGRRTEDEPRGKGSRLGFGGAPGFGLRGFINRYLSVRFDLRQMIIASAGEMHYPLSITFSLSLTTRSDV